MLNSSQLKRRVLFRRFWPARVLSTLVGFLACITGSSLRAHAQSVPPPPSLLLGAAWYPEQWPESRWLVDIELMQKAHLHVVRVNEFAWTALEPEEGVYKFDWLERAVNLAGQHGLYVVIGTPTAAPPVWMATKYPDILVTDSSGKLYRGATRNRDNWNSEHYRQFVRDIDERLAKRFGHNPYVIGWQIDNEYAKGSFDTDTQAQFHAWLARHYGSLDKLNEAWTTAYNNQTYSSWEQIPLVDGTGENSPALWLDSKRFISESLRGYQRVQIDALRRYADPRQKITTNMMGWFDLFDHYTVGQDLDVVGWDNPQVWGDFDPVRNGATHDLMRGLKNANYWVLESTAGPRGGGNASVILDRGAMRAALWSYIGHGADLVSYWQWRDALNGGEQNHGAIVDVDGEPDPIYDEYAQTGAEFEKASAALNGTHVVSQVAILQSYPSRWAINWQKMSPTYDPIDGLMSFYTPLHELGYSIDIVSPESDLSRYKLVIAPGLNVLTLPEADRLTKYVQQGGHLLLGQRSGLKDEHNSRWPQRQPGPLVGLLGARVEQYTALKDSIEVTGDLGREKGRQFAEELKVQASDVRVLLTYQAPHSWLDSQPAAVSRTVGRGSIAYLGAWLEPSGMKSFMNMATREAGLQQDGFPVPAGVELYRRTDEHHDVFVVENFSHQATEIPLPGLMTDVLSGTNVQAVKLDTYGVAVLSKAH